MSPQAGSVSKSKKSSNPLTFWRVLSQCPKGERIFYAIAKRNFGAFAGVESTLSLPGAVVPIRYGKPENLFPDIALILYVCRTMVLLIGLTIG